MVLPTWIAGLILLALGVVLFVPRAWLGGLWRRIVEWVERSPGLVPIVIAFALVTAACKGSPVLDATAVANGAAELEARAAPLLEERCVAPMRTTPDVPKLREVCDPAIAAYDAVRVADLALRASLVVYDAVKSGDPSKVVATIIEQAAKLGLAVFDLGVFVAKLVDEKRTP